MFKYEGETCPICREKFIEPEGIVVCPICGTPHHRKCFAVENKCAYEGQHDKWEWKSSNNKDCCDNDSSNEKVKQCPRCFNKNEGESLFCSKCGLSLIDHVKGNVFNPNPFVYNAMDEINLQKNMYDGISGEEFAKYIKVNAIYYIPEFDMISKKNKSKFNFAAFLFNWIWLFFRKMYRLGTVFLLIFLLTECSSKFVYTMYSEKIISDVLSSAQLHISEEDFSLKNFLSLDSEDRVKLINTLNSLPFHNMILIFLPNIIKLIFFVASVFLGFFANKFYLKNGVRVINQIKEARVASNAAGESVLDVISSVGGTMKFILVYGLFVAETMLVWIINFW